MTDQTNGLDLLNQRLERAHRSVPPPRHPRSSDESRDPELTTAPDGASESETSTDEGTSEQHMTREPQRKDTRPPSRKQGAPGLRESDRPVTEPDEPLANLAIRVRHSLDGRLGDVVHAFKREGIRTSKAELVEMLLWELPATPSEEFRRRLATFRRHAPRERPL